MHVLWLIVTRCFKLTWRLLNFVRECILNLFVFLLVLAGIGIWLIVQPQHNTGATRGALLLNLNGIVVDQVITDSVQWGRNLLDTSSNRLQENSLFELVDMIRQAKTDENITGIVLSLKDFAGADQPSLQYIGKALREFRDGGKPIYAIGDSYNQTQYYLASFANKIYLSPQGEVGLHGFSSNNFYYKSLLEKLKITTTVFRVGTYKSAVEPFIRDNMSPEAKEADQLWLNGLWENYLNAIAANRQLTSGQMFPDAATMLAGLKATKGDSARYALDNKWVDQLADRSNVEIDLIKTFGWNEQQKEFNYVSMYDYQPVTTLQQEQQIAVIFANGTITDSSRIPGIVGADTAAAEIRQARLDPKIKALVLRVNSPGGSVTGSEIIRSELAALHKAGKPIVVSMGGLAASGGYWISTPADYIIASPSTLTGSIGVFGVVNTVENTLGSMGIYSDGVATSPLADVSVTRALPEQVSQMIRLNVERGYKNFVALVAASRHKTPEQIDKIAQGRVWTGVDAKNNGLVDELGDFDTAVVKAAALAQLKTWQLWYPQPLNLLDILRREMKSSVRTVLADLVQTWLPAPLLKATMAMKVSSPLFEDLRDPQHRYAICLTCATVH